MFQDQLVPLPPFLSELFSSSYYQFLLFHSFLTILTTIGLFFYLKMIYFPKIKLLINQKYKIPQNKKTIAFMHPYSEGCAGGERVLWWMIKAIQLNEKWLDKYHFVLYTGRPSNIDNLQNNLQKNTQNSLQNVDKTLQDGLQKNTQNVDNNLQNNLQKEEEYYNLYYENLMNKLKTIFGIELENKITIIFLDNRDLLEKSTKLPFTLLLQNLSSILIGWEAITKFVPDIYIETHGLPFTYFLFKLFGGCNENIFYNLFYNNCKVISYTHYPTISSDMLNQVIFRKTSYNNNLNIVNSKFKSFIKIFYYKCFAKLYGFLAGYFCDFVMVNSTWTRNHVMDIWWLKTVTKNVTKNTKTLQKSLQKNNCEIVYPPCNVENFIKIPLNGNCDHLNNHLNNLNNNNNTNKEMINDNNKIKRMPYILSVGQFRPEKDHALQIKAFAKCLQKFKQDFDNTTITNNYQQYFTIKDIKLILLGGCRNQEDFERINYLKDLAFNKLNLKSENLEFLMNASFKELLNQFGKCCIGLHTMWNEHFGICIVEYMASGLITLAHNSGGPKMDIINIGNDNYNHCNVNNIGDHVINNREESVIVGGGDKDKDDEGSVSVGERVEGRNGFLAESEEEYADKMYEILKKYYVEREEMREIQENARRSALQYSEENFVKKVQECLEHLL